MKSIESNDQKFLILSLLVTSTLIVCNIPLFIKTLAANKFATPEIKQLSNQIEISELRENEQQLWNKIKEVNFEQNNDSKPQILLTSNSQNRNHIPIPQRYKKFLLLGDSTMYDLSPFINYDLRRLYHIKNVRLDYNPSGGFNRIDASDWYRKISDSIKSYQPDVLVVMLGTNDDKAILDEQGKYHQKFTQEWKKIYQDRVEKYAKLLSDSSVKKIYWIGQPISNVDYYNKFYPIINEIYRDAVKKYPKIKFLDTWNSFALNGKFAPILPNRLGIKGRVRLNDGVSFSEHGSTIIGDLIFDKMIKDRVITTKTIISKSPQKSSQKTIPKITRVLQPYKRFLLIGDSTMYDLGTTINNKLRKSYQVNNIQLSYKISTGLNRIDFYDWYANGNAFSECFYPAPNVFDECAKHKNVAYLHENCCNSLSSPAPLPLCPLL